MESKKKLMSLIKKFAYRYPITLIITFLDIFVEIIPNLIGMILRRNHLGTIIYTVWGVSSFLVCILADNYASGADTAAMRTKRQVKGLFIIFIFIIIIHTAIDWFF